MIRNSEFFIRIFAMIFPGLTSLFLILRAFIDGNTSDIRYASGVFIVFLLTLLFIRTPPSNNVKFVRKLSDLLCLTIPIILFLPFTVIVLIFGHLDRASFIFHLAFGTTGTPWGMFIPYIVTAFVFWFTIIACVYRMDRYLRRIPFFYVITGTVILALNPIFHDVIAKRGFAEMKSLSSYLKTVKHITSTNRPNIIIVYLEGLERTYGNQGVFPEAYKPIKNLSEQAIEFTQVHQITATGWSLAGIVATQCGVPLVVDAGNLFGHIDNKSPIVPSVTCLTDLTKDLGYRNIYISGTEIVGEQQSLYGFYNFFNAHGGSEFIDRSTMAKIHGKGIVEKDWEWDWGFRDDVVFEAALAEISGLVKTAKPFILSVATMDTHGPKAARGKPCLKEGDAVITDDISDAIDCTSRLAEKFVNQITDVTKGTNTKIIVVSDHLAHKNNAYEILNNNERRNTVLLLSDDGPIEISKSGSMIDIFPTLLDWVGWLETDAKSAGLGTSLLSDQKTLIEKVGVIELNSRLSVDFGLSNALWTK